MDPARYNQDYLPIDVKALQEAVSRRLVYRIGKDPFTANEWDWYQALSFAVRDRLIERWMETQRSYYRKDTKRVYYLSLEFLIGRTLTNSMLNMGFMDSCDAALQRLGLDLERLREEEPDAALGNGGLGRLAACFLDSMATLDLPGTGYGIRYEYGMFRQKIEDGRQVEVPDNWLNRGNPWEFPRPEVVYPIRFGGHVVVGKRHDGSRYLFHWMPEEEVMAMAYDTPIPGYHTDTVNNLRLWSARATEAFDLQCFNQGQYIKAVEGQALSENISKVLYPEDSGYENQKLRLRQQYFFVSASLQDILRRFHSNHDDLRELPDKVAIQLNDTHPAIAIPELMRLLLDEHELEWQAAWEITVRTFSYTNHTLLPEALETWPVELFAQMLPRHMQIIYEINRRFMLQVSHAHPGDGDVLRRMSIIGEEGGKHIRMANLAIVGSHAVNGVSALHTHLLKSSTFADFERYYPGRIKNVTNGITPRRWLNLANPELAMVINEAIGDGWVKDLERLQELRAFADDPAFVERFADAKTARKIRFAAYARKQYGQRLDPQTMYDVQVKRIHEYKRQLLNLMRTITHYHRMRGGNARDLVPRTVLIGGKAAPGYWRAKEIIRLIHDVADVIDNDPQVEGRLKLLFLPNYDVSSAAEIIPAANLSQQISTAGMEASGTGNMKLALNGALTIGTMDGANIEIHDCVGAENIFTFGLSADEVANLKGSGYQPREWAERDQELNTVLGMIRNGYFSPEEPDRYRSLGDDLLNHDPFMVLADYRAYMDADEQVNQLYANPAEWHRRALINTAMMGHFSSDRTIQEYAKRIWRVKPRR
jgi:starch phosphorylase